jgi:hypothetical protein
MQISVGFKVTEMVPAASLQIQVFKCCMYGNLAAATIQKGFGLEINRFRLFSNMFGLSCQLSCKKFMSLYFCL